MHDHSHIKNDEVILRSQHEYFDWCFKYVNKNNFFIERFKTEPKLTELPRLGTSREDQGMFSICYD